MISPDRNLTNVLVQNLCAGTAQLSSSYEARMFLQYLFLNRSVTLTTTES